MKLRVQKDQLEDLKQYILELIIVLMGMGKNIKDVEEVDMIGFDKRDFKIVSFELFIMCKNGDVINRDEKYYRENKFLDFILEMGDDNKFYCIYIEFKMFKDIEVERCYRKLEMLILEFKRKRLTMFLF